MKLKDTLLAVVIPFLLIGCVSSSPLSNGNLLNVKVIAGKTSTPLAIHFFTLKSDNVFKRLDYFELVDSKHINWNGELLSRAKTLLIPGHVEIFQVPISADMQYYALVIGFKDVRDNDNWRYFKAVPQGGGNVALLLSQESNGYTSKAVKQVDASTEAKAPSMVGRVGEKIGNDVSNRAGNIGNKAIDRTTDRIFNGMLN